MDSDNSDRKAEKTRPKKLVEKKGVSRVVTMSDLHGWYGPFVELLERTGVIRSVLEDESNISEENVFEGADDDGLYKYVGGDTTIVLVGDCIDGCSGTKKIVDLVIKLENQARMAGGDVITLMGNHEQQLLQASFKALDFEDFSPYGPDQVFELSRWIKNMPLVAIVNDVLFVHAGVTKRVITKVERGKQKDEDFVDAFRRILGNGACMDLTTTGGNWGCEGSTLGGILHKTGTSYIVVGHNSTYGKLSDELRLVGPELDGARRVFAIATDIANYGKDSNRKNTGGALSLRWTDEGIEAEFIYRNRPNQKFNLPDNLK